MVVAAAVGAVDFYGQVDGVDGSDWDKDSVEAVAGRDCEITGDGIVRVAGSVHHDGKGVGTVSQNDFCDGERS